MSSLILSKIDYCNSFYYNANNGLLQKLQIAQNSTAIVSSLLYDLHWLPIKQRIIYKICIIVYKCLHNSAPADSDIPLLLHLASNKCTRLKVTFNRRKVSDGAFSIYAPKLWNSLPDRLIQLDDFSVFRCDLKTFILSVFLVSLIIWTAVYQYCYPLIVIYVI